MHLKIQRKNGRAYLSVVQNYRQNGKVKSRTIETIGYADAYTDRYADPIAHFRAHVEKLNREAARARQKVELAFDADDTIEPQAAPPARLGASIALGCLDALRVRDFFRTRTRSEAPAAGRVFEMLATERMMHATSKRESWAGRASFPRPCAFTYEQVYAVLPVVARVAPHLDEHLLRSRNRLVGEPPLSRIFLICGSYAFPVDGGSERAGIAVALDAGNLPLGYHTLQGRWSPIAFREAADALKDRLGARRAVVTAGGLRDLEPTIAELTARGDGFVLYQRDIDKLPALAAWANDEQDYREVGGVQLKWRLARRALPDGTELPVKEVALSGGGYAVRRQHAVLVSSELDLSATAIVQLYRELWRQAEPFQPLEADFSSVPYPTPARDHIRAHFAVCYAAFLALRLLRWKAGWQHNAADTADALLRMEGVHLQRNYYLFNYRSPVTDSLERALGLPPARRLRTRAELRSIPSQVRNHLLKRMA